MAWTDQWKSDCDDKAVLARRDVLTGLGAIGVLAVAGASLMTASPAHAEPASACRAPDAMASADNIEAPVEAKAGDVDMPATDLSAQRYYRVRRRYWRRRRRWHRRYWRRARIACRRRWYRGRLVRVC